jgi:hypothetical protein
MNTRYCFASLLLLLPLAGCGSEGHGESYAGEAGGGGQLDSGVTVIAAGIDTGAQMTPPLAGQETGLFIEYSEDAAATTGAWHVTTSCDTELSGVACRWVVYATPPAAGYAEVVPDVNDGDDSVGWFDDRTAEMLASTSSDVDGFTLYTDPGATVEFEARLDDVSGQRFVYWVGDGAVHSGAPSNPIDLLPGGY